MNAANTNTFIHVIQLLADYGYILLLIHPQCVQLAAVLKYMPPITQINCDAAGKKPPLDSKDANQRHPTNCSTNKEEPPVDYGYD
jgi:hypothetical protein